MDEEDRPANGKVAGGVKALPEPSSLRSKWLPTAISGSGGRVPNHGWPLCLGMWQAGSVRN